MAYPLYGADRSGFFLINLPQYGCVWNHQYFIATHYDYYVSVLFQLIWLPSQNYVNFVDYISLSQNTMFIIYGFILDIERLAGRHGKWSIWDMKYANFLSPIMVFNVPQDCRCCHQLTNFVVSNTLVLSIYSFYKCTFNSSTTFIDFNNLSMILL